MTSKKERPAHGRGTQTVSTRTLPPPHTSVNIPWRWWKVTDLALMLETPPVDQHRELCLMTLQHMTDVEEGGPDA
jgi:hypothetical protein